MELPRNKMVGIKTKDIVFNPEPLKEEDAQLFQKLKSSILKRGQIRNIVVCESEGGKYECLEGSKITKAMMDLGQEDIMAINLGVLLEDEKNLVRLETFKDYFLVNYSQVGMVMKEMKNKMKVEDFCGTIPFDKRQSENLIAMTEFDSLQDIQMGGQEEIDTLIANNEPIVILFRGTFSNCRLFINETIKK